MKAINLSELFGQKIFRIPDYQRGYAWEAKQLNELWDDICEIPLTGHEFRSHYTGTIYVEACEPPVSESWALATSFYSIVDGQQRLTTISILLHELLKHSGLGYCNESKSDLEKAFIYKSNLSGDSRIYRFSYFSSDQNHTFLLSRIFEDTTVIYDESRYNLYSKNLLDAKTFFSDKLSEMNHQEREIIFQKVTTALKFDLRTIEKDLDVQAVFETMNNRGKPLSTLEKLKNRLMHLTEKLQVPQEDRKNLRERINQSWGVIYSWLAKNPNQILDEDIFLSAHLSLIRTPKDAVFSEKLAEEKVFEMFCNRSEQFDIKENGGKESPVSYEKIQTYIQRLARFAPRWYEVHNSAEKQIKKILLLNAGKEMKIFLTQVQNVAAIDTLSNAISEQVERILFRNRIQGIGLMDERTYATWARELYNHEADLPQILHRLNDLVNTEIPVLNMVQYFNSLYGYERGAKGFHRWGTLKYFLFEYDDYLKQRFREHNDKITFNDYDSTTIEHIIPQQYFDHWSHIVTEVTLNLTQEHQERGIKVLLNTLGNLTILKNGKNSSLNNRNWNEKRERFQTGSYNEIDIARRDIWDRQSISERGEDMLIFLAKKIHGLSLTESEADTILFSNSEIRSAIKTGVMSDQINEEIRIDD